MEQVEKSLFVMSAETSSTHSMNPDFSLVMPNLNHAEFLREAIESVLNQATQTLSVELLVVDGGSTDATLAILESYGQRLRWSSQKDSGQSQAINRGLRQASGKIIGWLNSDDLLLPGALAKVKQVFERDAHAQWIYGKVKVIDRHGMPTRKLMNRLKNIPLRKLSWNRLLAGNWISQMGVFWRREFGAQIGGLREDLHLAMDYDLWLRFWSQTPGRFINADLACFRYYANSKTGAHQARQFQEAMSLAEMYAGPGKYRAALRFHRIMAKLMGCTL